MRRTLLLFILLTLLLPSCSLIGLGSGKHTTTVAKPKYHHRWYDRKKDRHTKRIKKVRMKS
jgi:hypothetical protein